MKTAGTVVSIIVSLGGCSLQPSDAANFGDDAGSTSGPAPTTGADGGPTSGDASTSSSGSGPSDTSTGSPGTSDTGPGATTDPSGDASGSTGDASTSGAGTTGGEESSTGAVIPSGDDPMVGSVCGYGQNQMVTPNPISPELHVFAVYEPQAVQITVEIDRVGIPLTVVLSSYEPVDWVLQPAGGVQLDEVIVDGYNASTVSGQGNAVVSNYSGNAYIESCGYDYSGNGCSGQALVTAVEQLTGVDMASFIGCYNGTSFTLQ